MSPYFLASPLPVSDSPVYHDHKLLQIAMPMGGIGSGCVCLNGHGGLVDFSLYNHPSTTALQDGHGAEEAAFALLHVKGKTPITKLVEGPIPPEKLYDQGLQGQGYRKGGHEGLPRFAECEFQAEYPFGEVRLHDPDVPLAVSITGWNPFIPGDDESSSIPAAILEYTFQNTSSETVDFEFSYHLSHLAHGAAGWEGTRNTVLPEGGILFSNTEDSSAETFGTTALLSIAHTPRVKAEWFRGGWFDALSMLWREVSSGQFRENARTGRADSRDRNGGSLLLPLTLQPGEKVTVPITLAWHFPNANLSLGALLPAGDAPEACGPNCDCGPGEAAPLWRPFYAGLWKDAGEVARFVQDNFADLRARTLAFKNALYASTLPSPVLDAVASNLAILKSPTVLRQENGNVWGWEGCFATAGCCHGSCTHVWNYAQALPHLFPKLERTLREQEMKRSMDERGHVNFRSALPDGPTDHGNNAASDGQFGGIMKLYRDWQISGDTAWLRHMYPSAKLSLDFCIDSWDPERRGGLFEPHHNTYDIEFWGPDGMCGSIYVGALSAMAMMADGLGYAGDAALYQSLAVKAAGFLDTTVFNGEYYDQKVQWEGLRDKSFLESLESGTLDEETLALYREEGPKYQYGSGCLSDGIIGAWMGAIYGIPLPLDSGHVRSTLQSIFHYNYKADLFSHACTQRPGYALGHEAGLLLCTWPRGGKPSLPFVYSDEVWTGIEYQVASHLIEEGFVEEGLTLVAAVRSRYDGHVRNPFNEYECGSYYARAMASYALLGSLSGFRYSAVEKALWFGPKLADRPFQVFFAAESGFGTLTLDGETLAIHLVEGNLEITTVHLTLDGSTRTIPCHIHVGSGKTVTLNINEETNSDVAI
ncbi:MAG: GH116 family glycosyl hydrolase [Janthinobacterium lividum]